MARKEIEKKIQGITWSEVMSDLDKATKKLDDDSKEGKNPCQSEPSSDKT